MFITSVIAGCVAVFSNCEINKSSFLRDIIFYLVAVIYLILVFFDKHIKMWEAIGFLLLYAVYITVAPLSPSPAVITHTGAILEYMHGSVAHVMIDGRIACTGDERVFFDIISREGFEWARGAAPT